MRRTAGKVSDAGWNGRTQGLPPHRKNPAVSACALRLQLPVLLLLAAALALGGCGSSSKGGDGSAARAVKIPTGKGPILYSAGGEPYETNNLGSQHEPFELKVKEFSGHVFYEPNASADGTTVAFRDIADAPAKGEHSYQIFTVASKGGKPRQITHLKDDLNAMKPALSPDGSKIAFEALSTKADSMSTIYIADAKSGKVTKLTGSSKHRDYAPDFSPDGKWVVFARSEGTCTYEEATDGTCPAGIAVISATGGKVKMLATQEVTSETVTVTFSNAADPDWSPDGKWIAFAANASEPGIPGSYPQLYVTDAKGKEPLRRLTKSKGAHEAPAWAPDSDSIAFISYFEGPKGQDIHVISADGAELTKPAEKPDGVPAYASPAWVAVKAGSQ